MKTWMRMAALCVGILAVQAQAQVVVVVNAAAPVDSLTREQVSDLFLGKSGRFPNGNKAVPIEMAEGSALRSSFHQAVTGKSDAQLKSYWSKLIFSGAASPPRTTGSSEDMLATLSATPDGVGYIEEAKVAQGVKIVFRP